MRLFLAVEPDDPGRVSLAATLRQVQAHLGDLAAVLRWNAPDNIHVTLHFLGEVSDDRLPSLLAALGERLPQAPFEIETGGIGTFPPSGIPTVAWIGISAGADRLVGLHAELGRRLTAGGYTVEARRFSPHLTLARVREQRRRDAKGIAQALRDLRIDPIRWQVDRATLFRSHLSSSAPRYEPLQHIALSDYN